MVRLAKPEVIVTEVYANSGSLVVSADGKRVGLKMEPGPARDRLYREIKEHKSEILEAVTGDPLEGLGWKARTALYREALRWLDERTPEEAMERVTETLCQPFVPDRLNTAWIDGTFDEFREALKDYVRTGLMAARGRVEVSF